MSIQEKFERHHREFLDQIFPDVVRTTRSASFQSNFPHTPNEQNKTVHLVKEAEVTRHHAFPTRNRNPEDILNLYPVQHNLQNLNENTFDTSSNYSFIDNNAKDLLPSEVARTRMIGLIEKQKKICLSNQSEAINNRNTSTKSPDATNLHSTSSDYQEKSSNILKRKVVHCNAAPSYKGFSGIPIDSTEESSLNTCNSSSESAHLKEEKKIKICETETKKGHPSKSENIHCWKHGQKLINQHLKQPKPPTDNHSPTNNSVSISSSSTHNPKIHPHKQTSPSRNLKQISVLQNRNSLVHPAGSRSKTHLMDKIATKSLSVNGTKLLVEDGVDVHTKDVPQVTNKEEITDTPIRRSHKIGTTHKQVHSPKSEEKTIKRRNYDPDEIKKYIAKKKAEKKKQEFDQIASEKKRQEERQQMLLRISQQQREAFHSTKKSSDKFKDNLAVHENVSRASWEEIFVTINSHKEHQQPSDYERQTLVSSNQTVIVSSVTNKIAKSFDVNEMSTTQHLPTITENILNEEDFQAASVKNEAVSSTTKSSYTERLYNIHKSAALLTSKLNMQTSQLLSFFEGDRIPSKSFNNHSNLNKLSFLTKPQNKSPSSYSSAQMPRKETESNLLTSHGPSLSKSNIDDHNARLSSSIASKAHSSPSALAKDEKSVEGRKYFRIPDDLKQLDDSSMHDEENLSFGTMNSNKDFQMFPRDMFPSETLRKKLSKKASSADFKNKSLNFEDAKGSKTRLSFGADDTFGDFNLKLVHYFLTEDENKLKYQTSISKIRQQALEGHSKAQTTVSEGKVNNSIFLKRGSDDVHPLFMKKMKDSHSSLLNQSSLLDKSSIESDTERSSISAGQTLSECSESTQFDDNSKNMPDCIQIKKSAHMFNLRLGEKFLTKKEQMLRQRKERVLELLKRFQNLNDEEKQVEQLEMEATKKLKTFSDKSPGRNEGNNLFNDQLKTPDQQICEQEKSLKSGKFEFQQTPPSQNEVGRSIFEYEMEDAQNIVEKGDKEWKKKELLRTIEACKEQLACLSSPPEHELGVIFQYNNKMPDFTDVTSSMKHDQEKENKKTHLKNDTRITTGDHLMKLDTPSSIAHFEAATNTTTTPKDSFDHLEIISITCKKISQDSLTISLDMDSLNGEIKAEKPENLPDEKQFNCLISSDKLRSIESSSSEETFCQTPGNLQKNYSSDLLKSESIDISSRPISKVSMTNSQFSPRDGTYELDSFPKLPYQTNFNTDKHFPESRMNFDINNVNSRNTYVSEGDKECSSYQSVGDLLLPTPEKTKSIESSISGDSLGILSAQLSSSLISGVKEAPAGIPDVSNLKKESSQSSTIISEPDSGDSLDNSKKINKPLLNFCADAKDKPQGELELVDLEDISSDTSHKATDSTENGDLMKAINSAAEAVELFTGVATVKNVQVNFKEQSQQFLASQAIESGHNDDELKKRVYKNQLEKLSKVTKGLINTSYDAYQKDDLKQSKAKLEAYIESSIVSDLLQDAESAIFEVRNKKLMINKRKREQSKANEDPVEVAPSEFQSDILMDSEDEWLDDDYLYGIRFLSSGSNDVLEKDSLSPISPIKMWASKSTKEQMFYVTRKEEEVVTLISESLDIYWAQRRYGEPWENLVPPDDFLNKSKEPTNTILPCEKIYRSFIFELVGEVLIDMYSEDETQHEELQITCDITKFLLFDKQNTFIKGLPNTLETLKPTMIELILSLLPSKNTFVITKPTAANKLATSMGSKDGRDGRVESLLARELRLEEPDWINYEEDTKSVKNSIADAILKMIVDDTVDSVNSAFNNRVFHDDTSIYAR